MTFSWNPYLSNLRQALYLIESARKPIQGLPTPKKLADSLPTIEEVRNEATKQGIPIPDPIIQPLLSATRSQLLDPHHIAREAYPGTVAQLIERTVKNIRERKKPKLYLAFSRKAEGSPPKPAPKSKTNAWKTLREFLIQPENSKFKTLPGTLSRLMSGHSPRTPLEVEYQKLLQRKQILALVKHRIQVREEWAAASMKRARAIQANTFIPPGGKETPVPPKPPLFRRKRGK